jgi:uncharacterized protein
VSGLVTQGVLALIAGYQRFLSPLLPRACRFHPTCSEYCADAIRRHGLARGLGRGVMRLLRCQPFSHGGYDPVR